MSIKKRAVVICPGRGTYTKESLGSLFNVSGEVKEFLNHLDERRQQNGEIKVTDLDADKKFKTHVHTKGENASVLIYACAKADFMAINQDKYDIVAITGNSMGWYLTLAMSEVLDWDGSYDVINSMGSMMKEGLIGGQVIYPIVDENWKSDLNKINLVNKVLKKVNSIENCRAFNSIYLGGYVVLGANKPAVNELLKRLPQEGDFPFQLVNHGAFHTPLLKDVSARGFATLSENLFHLPNTSIIDGRGKIYTPFGSNLNELYQYTLGQQVVEPYNFTISIEVALKEFAPDNLILLGPGTTLGGAIAQTMIQLNWMGLKTKQDFIDRQKNNPFLISMGIPGQKQLVI